MSSPIKYINIPGLHNSDEEHWQSIWEKKYPNQFYRIIQKNWDQPDCETWINQIENMLTEFDTSQLILIGHSIGCMAIVHWLQTFKHPVKGVLFVAPSDAEKPNFPTYISGFTPIPKSKLSYPSILVASTDDHVSSIERCLEFSSNWGSQLIILENAGHIEAISGFGDWQQGFELLKKLE